ncbi:MAG: carbohydrate ABC transporter permease [Acidimicrobiales bacterium]
MAQASAALGSVGPEAARGAGRRSWPPRQRKGSAPQGEADLLLPVWLSRVVVVIVLIAVIVPIAYMLLMSFTPNYDVTNGVINFALLTAQNYVSMWSTAPLAQGLVNTLIIAGSSAGLSVVVALLAAYPLTRFAFRGRRAYLYNLIAVQTIPGTTLLLPLFAVFSWIQTTTSVQMIGSYFPIILTYMTFGVPLSTWLLFTYMRTVPRDLDEAALVDGCSHLSALVRVILPIMLPAVVVSFLFAFLVGWNDVLFASVFTNQNTQTLAIALERFSANSEQGGLPVYGQLMSSAVVSAAPVVVIYLIFQRYLVHGLAAGSVTG